MGDRVRLSIDRLGRRGEGVAVTEDGPVYLPYALPGEVVLAEVEGDRARAVAFEVTRPDRLDPFCSYFGRCGGCAIQALPFAPYAAWKRGLLVTALAQAGVEAEVAPLCDGHGTGRRRATFHARAGRDGLASRIGFMEARSHGIIEIEDCPILAPSMSGAVEAANRLASILAKGGKPLDVVVTATETGLDVDLRGHGALDDAMRRSLIVAAQDFALARLANHGDVLVEARTPRLAIGMAHVVPPPGAFLQATQQGEAILAELVMAAVGDARRIADLFCGIGTFALRLAGRASVEAFDSEGSAVAALTRAAQGTPALKGIKALTRDLFRRPLRPEELVGLDALVFDPPRAGAAAQAAEIARSPVPTVVAVSCDSGTFARDASTLVSGGYRIETVTPVDQFRHSAHVEVVGVFRRAKDKARRRRLLS